MNKFSFIIMSMILLGGCMQTSTNPSGSLASSNPCGDDVPLENHIKEVELFPMGNGKFSLFVRGNNCVSNSYVKSRWYEEVEAKCNGNYLVEAVGIKRVTMYGLLKPAVEGTFVCQ